MGCNMYIFDFVLFMPYIENTHSTNRVHSLGPDQFE